MARSIDSARNLATIAFVVGRAASLYTARGLIPFRFAHAPTDSPPAKAKASNSARSGFVRFGIGIILLANLDDEWSGTCQRSQGSGRAIATVFATVIVTAVIG